MKWLLPILMLAVAACANGPVREEEAHVRARDAAMDAATQRMIVERSQRVPGHPNLVELGKVEGYCERTPEGNQQIVEGDSLKEAAYRKYGNRVDAIVGANAFCVPEGARLGGGGPFQCTGTAVSFAR